MARKPSVRLHGFVGRIYKVISDDIGFIRPNGFWREDDGNTGLDIDDDLFVHIGAFTIMGRLGFEVPEALHEGMEIRFVIGPSKNKEGRLTAEFCSVHDSND